MTFYEINELRKKAENILESTKIYAGGTINFILRKTVKGKDKLIIGFKDFDENQYVILTNNKVLDGDCVRIGKKYRELFDEGIEGFIFENLDNGYEPVYMSLDIHADLWMFLDDYINETDYFLNGVYSYMNFCLKTGISHKLLFSHFQYIFEDLIRVFYYQNYWEYRILSNFLSGLSRLALCEKHTNDNKVLFSVMHFEFSPFAENDLIWKEDFVSKEKAIEFIKNKLVEFNEHNKNGEEEIYKELLETGENIDEE